jgi:hypothetical protein
MPQVSMFRLYVLRAMYVFMFVGLALVKWLGILNPPPGLSNAGSVLGAISLLALLSICRGWSEDFVYAACWRPSAAERWSRAVSTSW